MTYTPTSNEVKISGLPNFYSGGQDWAGETVVIPLTVSDPSQFYVKSAADGSLIRVDPTTAAQLYATSVAINNLNELYGPGQAYSYPTSWQQIAAQTQIELAGQNVLDFAESIASQLPALIPQVAAATAELAGLEVPGADVLDAVAITGTLTGLASTFLTIGATSYTNNLEFGLAYAYVQGASQTLNNAENEYNKYIFPNMIVPGSGITTSGYSPVDYSTVYETYYDTILSIVVGQAAASEISTLTPTLQENLTKLALTIFNTVIAFIPHDLGAVIGQLTTDGELFQSFATTSNPTQFQQSLKALIAAEENAVEAISPFSAAAIANDKNILSNSLAEEQGQVLGSTPTSTPKPVLSAKATAETSINTPLFLSSLFTPGASDPIDHFSLINTLQGPGELVVNGLVYTQGPVVDVTSAEFETAYFTAPQSGTDEIEIVAFDSSGNSAIASTTITVAATSSTPPTPSPSDLSISNASLVTTNLVAGGGGTVAFSVENAGIQSAPTTAVSQIYLSTNTTLDAADILVSPGAISDAGLASGASESEQLPFTLPQNIAGSYYLIVFAGDSDQVADGATNGHTYAIPIAVTGNSPPPAPPSSPPAPSGASPISIVTDAAITTRVGSEPAITSGALRATDTNYPSDTSLRYTIVTPPAYGRLINNFYTASTFTQADIDNGLVDYVQNGASVSSDSFSYYVSDPAGYRSPIKTFTFNILPALTPPPPAAPEVTVKLADDSGLPISGGPAFSTSNASLSGTANPGATVTLLDGSTPLGSPIADSAGNWTYSPSGLAQGGHYITASVTISGQSAVNYLSFNYDTITPPAPSTPQLSLGGSVADTTTPDFSGTSEANNEVLLLDGNSVIGTGMATPQGTWTIATGALGLGYHSVSAESIDPAGNIGPPSSVDTIQVVPPPPGEITLNDAAMLGAGDLSQVGTVNVSSETLTEYGTIAADGFSLHNLSRAGFGFVSWNASWAFVHNVGSTSEYYDGAGVLIVPTDALIVAGNPDFYQVGSAVADTIDLSRTDGTAFSLVSINVGPTGDYPTSAVFTGTLAGGGTITETVELNLPQNSPLQPVALTGFNDVTDVKFTERFGGNGDPTSIAFDNVVVGNATPSPSPPAATPLLAPITLDDAAMVNAGDLPLVSADANVFSKSTYAYYGPITADGFTITNFDRSDFAFFSDDSNFASVNGYSYNGADVLTLPIGQNFTPARVEVQRVDGGAFGINSIELDTQLPTNPGSASVTFTGITATGATVTETFLLDGAQGFQTLDFDASFDDLTSLQFVGSASGGTFPNIQFNEITLSPPGAAAVGNGETLNVSSGQINTGDVILSGGNAVISGGTAVDMTVNNGGVLTVDFGGLADPTVISSGGTELVSSGGTDRGALISGGVQVDYGYASGANISNGGLQFVVSGGSASGSTVSSGGQQYIGTSGAATGAHIAAFGAQVVFGSAVGALVSGTQYDFQYASGGTTYNNGFQEVAPGAVASGMTVLSGGQQYIGSGGVAVATTVGPQGAEVVFGSALGALVSGTQYDFDYASGGTTYNNGFQEVAPGAVASGMTVLSGSQQYIGSGGIAVAATIGSQGAEVVFGSALGALVSGTQYDFDYTSGGTTFNNGFQEVAPGAVASGMTVLSGGQQYIGSGGSSVATLVEGGGAEVVFGSALGTVLSGTSSANATQYDFAYASGGIIENGGFQLVAPAGGGTALAMTVASGGEQFVVGGGTASGTVIQAFGAEVVRGTDLGATISGTQYVDGLASGTVVASGGYQVVSAGGTISAGSISGGMLELSSGASDGSAPITFTGSGILVLDDSVHFSGTVAGFGSASLADRIDFSDISYVGSGSAGATTVSWTQLTSGANASGTLVVAQGGHTADITLLGQYVNGNFTLSSDGHGGTVVTDPPVSGATANIGGWIPSSASVGH